MDLVIEDENGRPVPNKEAKCLPEFKELFARQRRGGVSAAKAESNVLQEFLYVHYMVHYKSWAIEKYPLDTQWDDRDAEVRERLKLTDWKPDKKVKEAIEVYRWFMDQETDVRLLRSAYAAANATITYFENVDYDKRDSKGNFLYRPTEVLRALKEVKQIKNNLEEMIEALRLGASGGRMKGGGVKNVFEDPDRKTYNDYVKAREDITSTEG